MTSKGSYAPQRPITEQIEELKAKIALLDGDRKAYYESSQYATKSNTEKIHKLRRENAELRTQLRDRLSADDHVINQAFHNRPVERAAYSNKTGPEAVKALDYQVCDTKKKLNALCHGTASKMKRLEELHTQYDQLVKDASDAVATDAGESEDAQRLRNIENRLDKATLKLNEAEHIHKTYLQIRAKFQEEDMSFGNTLSGMEADIRKCRAELEELREMHADAQISRDAAQQELRRHEEVVYTDRKRREVELARMKKEAEEKKLSHERVEKRLAQRGSISGDDNLAGERAVGSASEEQQQKISSYEEAFKRIKEATGVSDLKEVVLRFENQGDTRVHLEELKRESEKQIQRLREEREKLLNEYEEMKYSGEAKLSSGQRIVEQYQKQLTDEKQRRDTCQDDLKRSSNVLIQCKAGVEHLSEKLSHIKAAKGHAPQAQISQQADEYVLDLLGKCEEKLVNLLGDLDSHGGQDVEDVLEKLQHEEFGTAVESKLPAYNTRVKLPQTHREMYDDEDESGDDEGDVLTRGALKKQSQQIIDQKTKKRVARKKKKGK